MFKDLHIYLNIIVFVYFRVSSCSVCGTKLWPKRKFKLALLVVYLTFHVVMWLIIVQSCWLVKKDFNKLEAICCTDVLGALLAKKPWHFNTGRNSSDIMVRFCCRQQLSFSFAFFCNDMWMKNPKWKFRRQQMSDTEF